jgi:nucleoside-diphosphate-sugar epimerase
MRVLITGGTGLTGGEIARLLNENGHTVRVVSRRNSSTGLPSDIETLAADCRDAERMAPLVAKADCLIHVAGVLFGQAISQIPTLRTPSSVILVSSAAIYSRHRESAVAYRAGEEFVTAARPDVAIVRPTMVYGSAPARSVHDRNVHHVLRFARRYRFLPLVGDGRGLIQPVFYVDLARAVAGLTQVRNGQTLDIGGQAPLTIREAAESVLAALGLARRIVNVAAPMAFAGAALLDRIRGSRWRERLDRLTEDRTVDNARISALAGVKPRGFVEGLREQVSDGLGVNTVS